MKKILFLLLIATGLTGAQVKLLLYDDEIDGDYLYAIDLNGTDEYAYCTPANLDLNDTDRVALDIDNDFELVSLYESDFTAGANGWIEQSNCTVTGNIDGIFGYDNVLAVSPDTVLQAGVIPRKVISIAAIRYRVTYEYYIPSDNYFIDGFDFKTNVGRIISSGATLDAWTKVDTVIDLTISTYIRFYLSDGGDITPDGSTNDTLYIKNMKITSYPNYTATGNHSFDSTSVTALTGTYSGMIVSDTTETPNINDDFTADITGWAGVLTTSSHYTVDNNGVGRVNVLHDSVTTTSGNVRTAYTLDIATIIGREYRIQYRYYVPSGNTTTTGVQPVVASPGTQLLTGTTTQDSWVYTSEDFIATGSNTDLLFYHYNGSIRSGAEGDIFYIDDVQIFQISGDSDSNYAYLPSADFTALEDGKKYTFQMQAQSVGVLGSDLFDSGAGEYNDSIYSWTALGTNTIDTAVYDSRTKCLEVTYVDNSGGALLYLRNTYDLTADLTVDNYYKIEFVYAVSEGSVTFRVSDGAAVVEDIVSTNTSWASYSKVYQAKHVTSGNINIRDMGGSEIAYIDSIRLYPVTPPDLTLAIGDSSWTWSDVDPSATETLVKNFEWGSQASASGDIKLFLSQADTVYIDEVDLSEAYDMTVQGWFNNVDIWVTQQVITNGGTNSTETGYAVYMGSNDLYGGLTDVSDNRATSKISDKMKGSSKWVYYGYTIDRTGDQTMRYYDTSGTVTTVVADVTGIGTVRPSLESIKLAIGASHSATGLFEGYIGETQIVRGYALTAAEILANYNLGIKGKHMADSYSDGTIVGWWKWKPTNNTIWLQDESTSGNDMTGVNITVGDNGVTVK